MNTLVVLARGAYAPWLTWLSLFVGAFALHSKLQKGGWSARSDRICLITQTRSVHTHATQQTVGPWQPRLHFRCTICFRRLNATSFLSTNGSDRHSINGSNPRDSAIPIKLNPPQNATDATSTWRSFSWRRDETILAGAPYRCDHFAIHAQGWLSLPG